MKQNLKSWLLVTTQVLCICVILFGSNIQGAKPLIWVMVFSGVALGIWALWAMRLNNLNIMPDLRPDSKLILHGPYRFVRHPMYSSVLVITLALVLNEGNLLRFGVWIMLLIVLIWKLRHEERQLIARFDEYTAYLRKTKRIIPFVF